MDSRMVRHWLCALVLIGSGPLVVPRVLSAEPPPAAASTRVEGKVADAQGRPVADAEVLLVELRRRTRSTAEGTFAFEGVPPGTYLLEAVSPRAGSAVSSVVVRPGEPASVELTLDVQVHREQVVVSASAEPRGLSEVSQPVTVLSANDLAVRSQPTLGQTLAQEPGVTSTYFAPGASRPVIRGMGGDRIRVLDEGIGVGDASNVSEDHAVAGEPLGADRIEIVRGPATLMYGGNAIGGVVNVLHGRIPDHRPDRALTGTFDARYGSVSEERAGAAELGGGIGSHVAWHLAGVRRETDDTSTPLGDLVNSDQESTSGSAGASWIAQNGFVGLSFGRFETNYGIPNPDEPIRIDLEQNRWDAQAEWNSSLGFLRGARLRFGMTDYEHAELEDTGEVGTRFLNDSWEGRVELPHREVAGLRGAFGVQAGERDLEAIGEEAFVPPTNTETQAAFVFEEFGSERITVQLGARYENQDATADDPLLPERSFDGVSGAAGLIWKWADTWSLAASLASTTRFPTAEELYANGPHLATFQFEVGDPDLQEEQGLGLDLSLRRTEGRFHGQLNVFQDDFDDFIFLQPTGNDIDLDGELIPEFRYVQTEARFRGAELLVDFELLHAEPHHLELLVKADTVRAEDRTNDTPLPRIPPYRFGLGLHYQATRLWARLEGTRVAEQDRVAPNETPTEDYTMLDAVVGYRIVTEKLVHDLLLRGTNLTDETARNHLSTLKEFVVLPGRDVSLGYKLTF